MKNISHAKGFRYHLAVKTLPIITSLVLVLGLGVLYSANNIYKQALTNFQLKTSKDLEDNFYRSLEKLSSSVEEIAVNDLVVNGMVDLEKRNAYLPLFLRSLTVLGITDALIALTDYKGRPFVHKHLDIMSKEDHSEDWKAAVLDKGKSHVTVGSSGVFAAAPIFLNNLPEGAVLTYVSFETLVKQMFLDHEERKFVVLNADQEVIFSSGIAHEHVKISSSMATESVNGYSIFTNQGKDSRQTVVMGQLTSPYNIQLGAVVDEGTLINLSRDLYTILFISVIGLLLASALMIQTSGRAATSTLNNLTQTISSLMENPERMKDQRVPENSQQPKELNLLALHFNQLLEILASSTVSRQEVNNILESLDELLLVTDLNGEVTYSNPKFKAFIRQIHKNPDTTDDLGMLPEGISIREYNIDNSTRPKIFIRWNRTPLGDASDNTAGFVITGQDITKIKLAEKDLRIKDSALSSSINGVVISDCSLPNKPIIYVNPAFERITGYSSEEALNRSCGFLQGKDTCNGAVDIMRKAFENEQPAEVEILNYKKSGEPFWNALALAPIKNSAGKVTHYIGIQTDITEKINVQKSLVGARLEAESANKSKSEFLASMSHEIRTPMNGVIGMLRLLIGTELNEKQRYHANLAQKSAQSLLGLINDILDFSKIEANKIDIETISFNLRTMIEELIEGFYLLAKENSVDLSLESDDLPNWVEGDPVRIQQVLTNLISNAIKFSKDGSVTVRTTRLSAESENEGENNSESKNRGTLIRFDVIDDGIGISEENQSKLFDSFSQADASTTRKFGGTGLGLAIAYRLCKLMGGRLEVESKLGEGSTFSAYINVTTDSERNLEGPNNSNETSDSPTRLYTGTHALLVDDNNINIVVAEGILEDLEIEVTSVNSGKSALDAIRNQSEEQRFSLVFMDCQMPEMDGYETTRRIRKGEAGEQFKNMVIIAMTANAMLGDREKCLEAGMNDYISKPIDIDRVVEVLKGWL